MKMLFALECLTAIVLILVLASLGWMATAPLLPESLRLQALEGEILGILGLLTAAILLVSFLALLQTRGQSTSCLSEPGA